MLNRRKFISAGIALAAVGIGAQAENVSVAWAENHDCTDIQCAPPVRTWYARFTYREFQEEMERLCEELGRDVTVEFTLDGRRKRLTFIQKATA